MTANKERKRMQNGRNSLKFKTLSQQRLGEMRKTTKFSVLTDLCVQNMQHDFCLLYCDIRSLNLKTSDICGSHGCEAAGLILWVVMGCRCTPNKMFITCKPSSFCYVSSLCCKYFLRTSSSSHGCNYALPFRRQSTNTIQQNYGETNTEI
jgi:hypothetical protein